MYPIEVEEALAQHPDVADVAVIGVPDERWGETVMALVVPRPARAPAADELVAFARERLAGYKLPRIVEFVDELPRTPSGKVLKRELRERYAARRASPEEPQHDLVDVGRVGHVEVAGAVELVEASRAGSRSASRRPLPTGRSGRRCRGATSVRAAIAARRAARVVARDAAASCAR